MASLHVYRSMERARSKGGYAGLSAALPLWGMSKRELVEIAIRMAELSLGDGDTEAAIHSVIEERGILRANGIL